MQVVARHAYALTFERDHVEQWAREQHEGLWGREMLAGEAGDSSGGDLGHRWVVIVWDCLTLADH